MFHGLRERIRHRNATLKSFGALLSSQILATGLAGVGCFIQVRFVDPDVVGYFGTFTLLTQYLTLFNIGWLSTLQRDYPYWIGKGDPKRARRIVAVAESWIVVSACLIASLFLVLTIVSLLLGNFKAAAGWGTQLIAATLSIYMAYLGATYRSSHEFVALSKVSALSSIMSFLMLPFVAWLGFWGLCLRGVVPTAAKGFLLHRLRPVRVAPRWDFRELLRLLKFGLIMDISGYLASSGVSATMGCLVVAYYGYAVWGLFVFALNGEMLITQFSYTITHIFIPRINQQMGMTDSLAHCVRYSVKPMIAGMAVAVGLIVAAIVVSEPLITFVAPKWIPALPILRVFFWVGIYPVLEMPSFAFVAARNTWPMTISYATTFVIFILTAGAAILLGLPPITVAFAYLTAKLTGVLLGLFWLWTKVQSEGNVPMKDALYLPQSENIVLMNQLEINRCADSPLG